MYCNYAIILLTVRMKCLFTLVLYNNCIKCTFYMHLIICEDCKHTRFEFTCRMTMLLAAFFSSSLMLYTGYLYGVVYIS